MPRFSDPAMPTNGLPVTHNPLQRINYQQPKGQIDPSLVFAQITQMFTDYGIQVIKDLTGIDISSWNAMIASLAAQSAAGQKLVSDVIAQFTAWLNPLLGIEEQKNLLAAGEFENAIALSGGVGWVWDSTVGRTQVGSAKASPTGAALTLLSNPIAVAEGQLLSVSVWVKWASVTASGQAFKLDVNTYSGDTLTGVKTIGAITDPVSTQSAWQHLSDNYTIPAGVTTVKVRLVVQDTTAGTVWFDDATVYKTTLLEQQSQQLQDDAQAKNDAFATLLTSWWATLTTPAQTWPELFASLDAAWQTYVSTNNSIVADEWATLTDIVNGLFGINPASGQLPSHKVEGLGDSWTQLGAALSGDLANAGDWAWLAQIMITWFGVSSTAHSMAVDSANTLGIRNNVPVYVGPDNTSESNMPTTSIDFTTTVAASINSTGISIIGFVRCQHDDVKGAISFLAARPASSFLYITAYKLNGATLTRLWSSAEISLLVPATKDWARYVFPPGNEIPVDPGDVLGFEFHYGNSVGALDIYGQPLASGLPNHPSAILKNIGGIPATHRA
jgi:hypothetical protein